MWEFNLNNLLGNISLNIIEICIVDLTINLLLPHVVFTGVTTRSFEFTNTSSVKLLHTNSPICDFEISTQKFKTATMVDWMKQLYFMIGSVVYTRSSVVAPKVYEKSLYLCIEHCPLECAKMCSTVCIYMCLRFIKTLNQMVEKKTKICNLHESWLDKVSGFRPIKPKIEMQPSVIQFFDFLSFQLFWALFVLFQILFQY